MTEDELAMLRFIATNQHALKALVGSYAAILQAAERAQAHAAAEVGRLERIAAERAQRATVKARADAKRLAGRRV